MVLVVVLPIPHVVDDHSSEESRSIILLLPPFHLGSLRNLQNMYKFVSGILREVYELQGRNDTGEGKLWVS
ncbi:hypothetical protein HanRHA438_Chr10g0463341 [Helianthus annuus]|nr:hypothetical protein HanRHA438_Chr10g0463341 [Helianthus annuus]